MASVTSEGVAGADRRVVARRLRAVVLGPRGGGTTRRRASDAFRLGFAVVVVAVSVPVMRANSAAEVWLVHASNPPPDAVRWLVTSVFWLGSAGVIVLLVVLGLLVPRLAAVRWTAVAAVITWGLCLLLGAIRMVRAMAPPARPGWVEILLSPYRETSQIRPPLVGPWWCRSRVTRGGGCLLADQRAMVVLGRA